MTESTCKEDERFAALLGLAATKPEPDDACPEPEMLAAFIENRLPKSRRQQVLSHLDRCEHCYQEWLEVSLSLEEARPAEQPVRKPAWWQRLRESLRPRPWLVPLTAAVAMTLAVLAVVIQKPAAPVWQPQQLAELVRQHTGIEQTLARLPQANTAFAFSDTNEDPARRAFIAGLRDAQRWLGTGEPLVSVDDGDWRQSAWRDYYHLGQWMLLAWTLANSDPVSAEEWRVFDRHCLALIDRFQRRPEGPARDRLLTSLQEVHGLMSSLADRPDPVAQARLARKLQQIIRQWLV